jgi:fatty-acyl-CoA synthase
MDSRASTVAELIAARWGDHRPGLRCEDRTLTHHEVAAGAAARAALLTDLLPPTAEPHLGVLLDNTPEFPLWLGAAALAGAAVAGVNPTLPQALGFARAGGTPTAPNSPATSSTPSAAS